MIFLNNASCQRQTKAPPALLGRETGAKHVLHVFLSDTFSRVNKVNHDRLFLLHNIDIYATASTFQGINSILAEVLNDPFEERNIEVQHHFFSRSMQHDDHRARRSTVHVGHNSLQHSYQVGLFGRGLRADFREAVSDKLKPFHVVVHLRKQFIIGISLFHHLHPGHKTGNRSAELMSRFLAQTYPNMVLFGTFQGQKCENSKAGKEQNDAQLDIRIPGQAAQKQRLGIAYINIIVAIVKHNADNMTVSAHALSLSNGVFYTVCLVLSLQFYIAIGLNMPLSVNDNHRNSVVFIDYFQYKCKIGMLICSVQRTHCFGPYLHSRGLFLGQIADEKM